MYPKSSKFVFLSFLIWLCIPASISFATDPLFEITDDNNRSILAVYSDGIVVRDTTGDTLMVVKSDGINFYTKSSTSRGAARNVGFIGAGAQRGTEDKIMIVGNDSINFYTKSSTSRGAARNVGFIGAGAQRGSDEDIMIIAEDSIRFYLRKSGGSTTTRNFEIQNEGSSRAGGEDYFDISPDSIRFYADSTGGFAVGTVGSTADKFMNLTPKNYLIGHESGQSMTSGEYNTFLGYESGYSNTSGSGNIFIGYQAGKANTDGGSNTFIGYRSGTHKTTGAYNVFLGSQSGREITSGAENTFLGHEAGILSNSAIRNTCVGCRSGEYINTGEDNTFVGRRSGGSSTGSRNVCLGSGAGIGNNYSNNNVFIGYQAGISLGNDSSSVCIGYKAGGGSGSGFVSNSLFIENGEGDEDVALIYGRFDTDKLRFNADVGIGKAPSSYKLDVDGDINISGGYNFKIGGVNMQSSPWSENGDDIYYNDGNVGIGTSSPYGLLSIQNIGTNDTTKILVFSEDENAEFYLESGFSGSGGTGNNLKLKTYWGNTAMCWRGDGNVGIGTTAPQNNLDIEGNAVIGATYSGTNTAPSNGLLVEDDVGIGTTSPVTRLHVKEAINGNADPDDHVVFIENSSTGTSPDVLCLKANTNNPGTSVNFITFKDDDSSIGSIEGDGSGGISFNSGSGDFAEYLPLLNVDEKIEDCEIVGVFGGKITKNTKNADKIMAISSRPIVLGNDKGDNDSYKKVAFLGQVQIKVRGIVNLGDYIIPSGLNDGIGIAVSPNEIKGKEYAQIVAIAWEASDNQEVKLINAAVGLNNPEKEISILTVKINQQEQEIKRLKSEIEGIKSALQK